MNEKVAGVKVRARLVSGVLWEDYTYTAGIIEPVSKHHHDSYQLCFSYDSGWRYFCRGEIISVADGILSLINPEDAHSIEEKLMPHPTFFTVAYLKPEIIQNIASQITGNKATSPRFATMLDSKNIVSKFRFFWKTHAVESHELERDESTFNFFDNLFAAHSLAPVAPKKTRTSKNSINKVRDYLADNLTENVSIQFLSDLSALEPTYLIRAFRQTFGISPHQYHLQRRIERAKTLLLKKLPLTQIAYETGFFDQSHFGLHFRRLVGVSPQKYRR